MGEDRYRNASSKRFTMQYQETGKYMVVEPVAEKGNRWNELRSYDKPKRLRFFELREVFYFFSLILRIHGKIKVGDEVNITIKRVK